MNDSSDSEFKRLFGDARSIKNDRVNLLSERQKQKKKDTPVAISIEQADEQNQVTMTGAFSESWFKPGIQKKLKASIRAGEIRPEASLDLHGLRAAQASTELDRFIKQSLHQQRRMVLVIHGQGYGSDQQPVLKPLVFRQLANYPEILAWCPAQRRDGAGGATYVYLKSK